MTTKALAVINNYNAADDFADMRQQDTILPRLAIQQGLSPLVMDGKAAAGDIVDSSTNKVLIKKGDKSKIIPLMFWLEWIEWNPDRNAPKDKKVIERSTDPNSELARRAARYEERVRSDGKKEFVVTEYYNFIVLAPEATQSWTDMFSYGFCRSSHKVGKLWLNKMSKMVHDIEGQRIKAPMWSNLWELSTVIEVKENNRFAVPVIGGCERLPDDYWTDLSLMATALRERRSSIVAANSGSDDTSYSEAATQRNAEM